MYSKQRCLVVCKFGSLNWIFPFVTELVQSVLNGGTVVEALRHTGVKFLVSFADIVKAGSKRYAFRIFVRLLIDISFVTNTHCFYLRLAGIFGIKLINVVTTATRFNLICRQSASSVPEEKKCNPENGTPNEFLFRQYPS